MIDMHNHILFGLDDGAKTIDESIILIKEEIKKGISHIILTPHFKKRGGELNKNNISINYEILREYVIKEKLNVELYLGSEIYVDSNFYELFDKREFNTLAGSNYILIEFSLVDTPENISEICYEAKLRGYVPILAHVERYISLFNNKNLLRDVLNEGALLQVNASTVINKENKESFKFANYLLKNELVSFVASDLHNMDSRGFYLDEAYKYIVKKFGVDYAEKIFSINQQNIISNKYFDIPKMNYIEGGFLAKLFTNT